MRRSSRRSPQPVGPIDGDCRLIFAVVWIVLVGGLGLFLWNAGRVDAEFIVKSGPYILGGIWITILVSVLSIIFATVLAILGALGRLSTNPVTYAIASLYVSLVPGTPLLVQIFFVYYALPQAGIVAPADPDRHPRPRPQLRRVHDRDLPRRHPGRSARPERGGAGARHARVAYVSPDRPAAGGPDRDAGDRQRVHRDDQGQLRSSRSSRSTRAPVAGPARRPLRVPDRCPRS